MTDDLVTEARKGGPCAELGDRCRAIEAASGCFCAAVADRIEQLERELSISRMAQVVMDNSVEALTAERDDLNAKISRQAAQITGLEASRRKLESLTAGAHRRVAHVEAERDALQADNARLRAIGTEMAESIEGNYYLPGVATRWRAAINHRKGAEP